MTIVCLHYPLIIALFFLTALMILLAHLLSHMFYLLAGVGATVLFLMGFFYAIPSVELLLLFLILVLLSFLSLRKEDKS